MLDNYLYEAKIIDKLEGWHDFFEDHLDCNKDKTYKNFDEVDKFDLLTIVKNYYKYLTIEDSMNFTQQELNADYSEELINKTINICKKYPDSKLLEEFISKNEKTFNSDSYTLNAKLKEYILNK